MVGGTVVAGPRFVGERTHELWITPHGALGAASRNNATAQRSADGGSTLSFTQPGRFSAKVHVAADGLVTQVESIFPDAVLGDTPAVTSYSGYRDAGGGVQLPTRIRQTVGGWPVLNLTVKEVQPNAPAALAVPDAVRNVAERVTADKVAEGAWFIAGGSHNSVAIELRDSLILVEAPLGDARILAVFDAVRPLAPGKPIPVAVNSHPHFDHAGGVRAAVAEGAAIVTAASAVAVYEQVLARPSTVRPDRLAQSGRRASVRGVADKLDLGDAARPVEVHRIAGSNHSDAFVLVYLPRERLLIEADAFTLGAPNTTPPAR